MALSDAGRSAMAYWGTIQAAVTQRASTAEIWDAVKAAQAAEPGGGGSVTLQGLNELRSVAAQLRNGSEKLAAARATEQNSGLSQGITGQMMAVAPWSQDQQVLSTLADYQVRFEAQFTTPLGAQASVVLTALFPNGALPATVGDLIDALGAWAPASGSLPVGTFDGIGDVSIVAV